MNIMAFNWTDYTILGIVFFSTLISFARGFVREAISLASWIAATWVAYRYGHDFGGRFLTMLEMGQARSLIGAAILFFAVLIIGAFVNYSVNNFVVITGLSAIDRILGMAFGFARGLLLVAVLILLGQITQMDKKPWWTEAQLIPQFAGITEWLKNFVPEQIERLKPVNEQKTQPVDAMTIEKTDTAGKPESSIPTPTIKQPAPAPQAPATTEQEQLTEPVAKPVYY